MIKGKVGLKGELFPPKEIREQTNLEICQEVMFRIVNGILMVQRIYSPEEILNRPKRQNYCSKKLKVIALSFQRNFQRENRNFSG